MLPQDASFFCRRMITTKMLRYTYLDIISDATQDDGRLWHHCPWTFTALFHPFLHFPCSRCFSYCFLPLFSIMQHPSPLHSILGIWFFEHIMILMMFPACCNQKSGVLWWAHRMKHWNWCQNLPFFRCEQLYIVKRLFSMINHLLYITLSSS